MRFPALRLARLALQAGQGAPTILNAANEAAVALFLDRRLGFLDIAAVVEETLAALGNPAITGLDAVLALDAAARRDPPGGSPPAAPPPEDHRIRLRAAGVMALELLGNLWICCRRCRAR